MVRIISQNVCGLRNDVKRRALFLNLKQKADIICMQETHSDINDESFWTNEFKGNIIFSHGKTDSCGTLVAVKQNTDIEICQQKTDKDGRLVIIQFKCKEELFVLASIYAPNRDNPHFFLDLFRKIEEFEGKRILLGDFNLALDVEKDRFSTSKNVYNNDKSLEILKNYMTDTMLIDIWRNRNPGQLCYTYGHSRKNVKSRIDFILVDQALSCWTEKISIKPGYKSDHSAIYIAIKIRNECRGRGTWKLNNRLLTNLDFVQEINKTLDESVRLTVGTTMNSNEIWESVKLSVINRCKELVICKAGERKLIISQLEEQLEKMLERGESSEICRKTKQDLEDILDEQAKGAIFRSKLRWYNEGEKSNKYFLNLEKNRSGSNQ